jgi:hypothetical protein
MVDVRVQLHSDELEESQNHDDERREAADSVECFLRGQESFRFKCEYSE